MQNTLFRKGIILALIGLFFGINAASSTENIVDYSPTHNEILDSVDKPEWFLSNGCIAYTIIGSYPNCSGIFEFELGDLENLTYICECIENWGCVAWISPGDIIFSDIYGNIYDINLETCEYTFLGNAGTGIVSLAYDQSSETLYGISTSNLYTIDMGTGLATLIGPLGTGSLMISIDCDRDGNLYGVDLCFGCSDLYSIDTTTGRATSLGPFGVILSYFRCLVYDKDYDVLYLCYINTSNGLYELNPIIGNGSKGTFEVDEDIIDLTISFTRQTQPPNAPYIRGPKSGKVGIEYEYNFSLSDPDNNPMYLRVDWGNGTSGPWQGPYAYDTTIILNHTWYEKGTNTIRAQAKDIYNAESEWATLEITIPKSYNPVWWLNNLLERFPLLQLFLGWLMC